MIEEAPAWSTALEARLVRELARCFEWANYFRFGDRLTSPVLVLSETTHRLGQWNRANRTLSLSRRLVLDRPWPEVVGVLEHEMAHQFVDEVLGVRDETAHGETFAKVCAERGIDGRAAGAPMPSHGAAVDRALDRIRKLLALASSSNRNEAELAMRTAHELMLRHNIEEAAARTDRGFEIRHVGDPSRRSSSVENQIVAMLAELFFVKTIRIPVYLPRLGRRGMVYEIAGTRANVEMACHVHAFLLATADRLWREVRTGQTDARVRSGRDRLAYQSGVIRGFRDKIVAERSALRGTGLVWRGDADLDRFYRARHPRVVTRRGTTRFDDAHRAGCEAGKQVVLHRPVEQGAKTPRLLRG